MPVLQLVCREGMGLRPQAFWAPAGAAEVGAEHAEAVAYEGRRSRAACLKGGVTRKPIARGAGLPLVCHPCRQSVYQSCLQAMVEPGLRPEPQVPAALSRALGPGPSVP
ncbi:UNVERIFIED_CONTAM: hypothetical protein FKN15_064933 [Acipenser sinensis]